MVERIEPYGAFVDGPWGHGLVHVSQMARRFVNDPREVVKLGQVVRVWVLRLDAQERVQLTMIPPDQGQTFRPKEGDENLRQEVALSDSAGSSLSPSSVIRLTPTEEQLLTRHLRFYNQLARGERKPTTPAQQHFVAVCKGEVAAETEHEIAYKKHREREGGRNRTRG
jgi:transcriptional accessory protein Tex/SPT6